MENLAKCGIYIYIFFLRGWSLDVEAEAPEAIPACLLLIALLHLLLLKGQKQADTLSPVELQLHCSLCRILFI